MGLGTRYPFVERILRRAYRGGRVLEIAAGGALYGDLFERYVATDLPTTPYARPGDLGVACDAGALPFRVGSFDLVFVVAALFSIPDPGWVGQQVWMCLRPGGRFLVFDYTQGTQRRALLNNLRRGNPRRFAFWSRSGLAQVLYECGFHRVRQRHRSLAEGLLWAVPGCGDRWGQWLILQAEKG
ncbi:MAG: methyltransferase domain-containing protein [Candidatus Latescibacterota bacterium]